MSQAYTDDCFASDHVVQTDQQNVENNFAALKSSFSGPAAPADLIAGMWWFDTTNHLLKERNEANNAWLSIWDLANNKPIIANLSNEITGAMIAAAVKDPIAATAGLRTLGAGAQQAAPGNDARFGVPADGSVTEVKLGAGAVAQAKLKTSLGSVNRGGYTGGLGRALYTLPGGQYGFYPQFKDGGTNVTNARCQASLLGGGGSITYDITTTYITYIELGVRSEPPDPARNVYVYAQQRYVTASGEVFWIFILRDKVTKDVFSMYQAPDHPCFGNGGKPLLVPHPFRSYDSKKHEIIVINPSEEEVLEMQRRCSVDDETKPDKDLLEVIAEDYEIDESSRPKWPTKEVTVGLPPDRDWKRDPDGTPVVPIKKKIPKPDYIKVKSLRRKR